jgi:hypothetical protein
MQAPQGKVDEKVRGRDTQLGSLIDNKLQEQPPPFPDQWCLQLCHDLTYLILIP